MPIRKEQLNYSICGPDRLALAIMTVQNLVEHSTFSDKLQADADTISAAFCFLIILSFVL